MVYKNIVTIRILSFFEKLKELLIVLEQTLKQLRAKFEAVPIIIKDSIVLKWIFENKNSFLQF